MAREGDVVHIEFTNPRGQREVYQLTWRDAPLSVFISLNDLLLKHVQPPRLSPSARTATVDADRARFRRVLRETVLSEDIPFFEVHLQAVRRGWVVWRTIPSEVQRRFVQMLAAEHSKAPQELNTNDFYQPLKFLNGGMLSGLLNNYQQRYGVRPREAVVRLLRDLQLLSTPAVEPPRGTTSSVLEDLRRGHVFWDAVPRDVQRQLVETAARELGRSPSEMRVTDFLQPIKALHNRSLGGLLGYYGRRDERNTIRSLKRLKRALRIAPFKPSATLPSGDRVLRETIRDLIHSYVKWDSVPLDVQHRLVLLLAKELGKTPWELERQDFNTPIAALDQKALGGLQSHYGSMKRLRERLGIGFPWSSDDELAVFMRQRSANPIRWNAVPATAQRRIVQLAAHEFGKSATALTTDDFTRPVRTFGDKSLKGLLDYYRKISDSYVDALRLLKATLHLASETTGLEEPSVLERSLEEAVAAGRAQRERLDVGA